MITTVMHPNSGETFVIRIGPSDFYNGKDRILEAAGPLNTSDGPETYEYYLMNNDDRELDAAWLSIVIANAHHMEESDLYGHTLWSLLPFGA